MPQRRKDWYPYGIYVVTMLLLTITAFGNLSTHLFDTDDREYMRIGHVLEDPGYLFSSERIAPMRPLTDATWLVGYALWKDNPAPYHIVVVVLHLLVSLFLAYTFRQLGVDLKLSLIASLLFLMNVAHFRVVHWLTCIVYVLTLIAVLCFLIFYNRFLESGKRAYLFLAIGTLFIAISTHASSISVALFCFYMAYRKKPTLRQAILSSWLLGTVALFAVVLSYLVSPQVPQVRGLFIPPNPISILRYLFWYLSRLVTNAHWLLAGWNGNPTDWELYIGFLICMGVIFFFWRTKHQATDWGVWCFISVLPFIHRSPQWQYVPFGPSRQLYLASVGSSFILAWLIISLAHKVEIRRGKHWGHIMLGVLLLGILGSSVWALKRCEAVSLYSSARSYIARGDTQSGIQLLERAIAHDPYLAPPDTYARTALARIGVGKSPQNILQTGLSIYPNAPILNLYLGIWEAEQKNPTMKARGEATIQKAFALSNRKDLLSLDAATCYYNLGTHHFSAGNHKEAAKFFYKSLIYRPDDPNTMILLGNTLYAQGQEQKALEVLQRAIQISPEDVRGHQALGLILDAQGKVVKAIEEYKKVLQLNPKNWEMDCRLASILYSKGKLDEALYYFRQAISLKPEDPRPYRNLAVILTEKNQLSAAIDTLEVAVHLASNHTDTWQSLAIMYNAQGRYNNAVAAYKQTVRLSPDDWEAHLNLAQTYEKLARIKDAAREYRKTLTLNPNSVKARNALQTLSQ